MLCYPWAMAMPIILYHKFIYNFVFHCICDVMKYERCGRSKIACDLLQKKKINYTTYSLIANEAVVTTIYIYISYVKKNVETKGKES